MKIVVIQGPNLNMLGHREQNIYGAMKLEEIHAQMEAVAKQNNFEIMKGHGISSVTDISNYEFEINFVENLRNPEDYLALTNITGVQTNVTNTKINIQLPQNFDYNSNIPIQVGLIKIYF